MAHAREWHSPTGLWDLPIKMPSWRWVSPSFWRLPNMMVEDADQPAPWRRPPRPASETLHKPGSVTSRIDVEYFQQST